MILEDLALFLRIVEKGGLAAAGREMGLSPSSVSERLAALERHYGASLLTRTTRAVAVTEEGRILVEGARRLLAEAEELDARIRLGSQKISGPIRITAAEDLGRSRILPLLDAFARLHPDVTLDLHLTDASVDLVSGGMDLAIRQGVLADSTMKTRFLCSNRRIVCAAPSYLEHHGVPSHPAELAGHDCIVMRFGAAVDNIWPFQVGGDVLKVMVKGRRVANDGWLVRQWCLQGHGLAYKSLLDVEDDLASGALVEVLRPFNMGETAMQVVYPATAVQPRRVRLLIDYIVDGFRTQLKGDDMRSPV